jgi:dGTPase
MFEHVYERANKLIQENAERMLCDLYDYFTKHVEALPPLYHSVEEREGISRAVCDYLSSMTDQYAITVFTKLYIPGEGI